ncbi:MAG: lycopene cyclase domain-containing protein [Verrucomicrobiota bacterium]
MSYLLFHFVFILPVIFVVALLRWERGPFPLPGARSGTFVLAIIAFVYTTPWDNFLVQQGVWYYGVDRVIEAAIIGYVPFEEYLFFILQPFMTAGFLLWFLAKAPESIELLSRPLSRGTPALIGCGVFIFLSVAGLFLLLKGELPFRYLSLILVWACPILAFQWGYGGGTLVLMRRQAIPALIGPTAYLWVVDLIALKLGIWTINPEMSTGLGIYLLPIEEAIFFLLTNMLVIQGLLLYYQFVSVRQKASSISPAT